MHPDDEAIIRDSGERLAISLTISVLLAELAGRDQTMLARMHDLLSEHIEVDLASLPNDGLLGDDALRGMYAEASASVDRIFRMAKKLHEQRGPRAA